jgi:hypothetical protein
VIWGCWKSRVVPLEDNDAKNKSLCELPTFTASGQPIAYCMSLITVDDVAKHIERYMSHLDYEPKF